MENNYNRLLFEQQTPYLQWLRQSAKTENVILKNNDEIGERFYMLPYLSCEDIIDLKDLQQKIPQNAEYVVWAAQKGFLADNWKIQFESFLNNNPQVQIVYADEDYLGNLEQVCGEIYGLETLELEGIAKAYEFKNTGKYRGLPWFKPEYSPDTLNSFFYFGHIFAMKKTLLWDTLSKMQQNAGELYKVVLYSLDLIQASNVGHISEVLYTNADILANDELEGINAAFKKKNTLPLTQMQDLISIIIPSKDNSHILESCLRSLCLYTAYRKFEIIIVDNGSKNEERLCIKNILSSIQESNPNISLEYVYEPMEFNFSKMCNLGAKYAKGKYLLFLNDDIEILQNEAMWLNRMLEKAVLPHSGAVGAKLLYPRKESEAFYRIQHVGITNMEIGPAHKLCGCEDKENLYHGHNKITYDMLAVTAACMLIAKDKFYKVKGFDEELKVAYNDVELCFKLYEAGFYNIQCNEAVLLHHESVSRGHDISDEKQKRLESEKLLLYEKHTELKGKDAFYSPKLVQNRKDINYTCNFINDYEKQVLFKKLPQKQIKKLPKVHSNKYIRILTKENLMMSNIDSMFYQTDTDKTVLVINAWAIQRNTDNGDCIRKVILKNMDNGSIYISEASPVFRKDVAEAFKEQGTRLALSGIHIEADISSLPKGQYQVGIWIFKPSAKGYLHWYNSDGFVSART